MATHINQWSFKEISLSFVEALKKKKIKKYCEDENKFSLLFFFPFLTWQQLYAFLFDHEISSILESADDE